MNGPVRVPSRAGVPWPVQVEDSVWVLAVPAAEAQPSTHPDDRRRAALFPRWRADRFLLGRGLLRALLRDVAPHLADADVVPDPRGRPRLAGFPGAGVSVSYGGSVLACAVAACREVGVDVQDPAGSVSPGLARRLLRGRAAAVLALPAAEAAAEVTWVWTAQEACVKAAGSGLAGRPWEIDVPPASHHGRWGAYRWTSLREHSPTPLSCAYGPSRQK